MKSTAIRNHGHFGLGSPCIKSGTRGRTAILEPQLRFVCWASITGFSIFHLAAVAKQVGGRMVLG